MDVMLVLTALTVFVGARTLALVRTRRASRGRRVIVAAALRPRSAVPRPPEPCGQALPAGLADGDGHAVFPTRRSLRASRSAAPPALSTLAAPTGAWRDDAGRDGTDGTGDEGWGGAGDTVGAPAAQLLPPSPRGRRPRRVERQHSSHGSAA